MRSGLRETIHCTAAFAVILICLSRSAQARWQTTGSKSLPEPNVLISQADRRNFAAAFGDLASQAKITIMSEGAPLHPELNADEIAGVDANLPQAVPVPLSVALSHLAAAFDYDAEHTYPNVVILRKRYSEPTDLPCVTFEEVVHSLEQMLKLTEFFSAAKTPGANKSGLPVTPQTEFAASLTPDQLRSAGKGLLVTELGPEKQALALRAAEFLLLTNQENSIRTTLDHLRKLQDPNTKFGWMSLDRKPTFGYLVPEGLERTVRRFPLTNGFRAYADGSYFFSDPSVRKSDPTVPTPEDTRLAPGMFAQGLSCVRPLANVAAIETSPASGKKSSVRVNAALAQKPVGIFGEKYSTQDRRVRSLAAVYGLRLLVGDRSDYTLTLASMKLQPEFADYPADIARLLPTPLSRMLDQRVKQYAEKLPQTHVNQNLNKKQAEARARQDRQRISQEAAASLYFPSVRRIIALALSAAPRPASAPVSIDQLNPEVLRLVALATVAGPCLKDIDGLANMDVPTFVTNPEIMFAQVAYEPDLFVVTAFGSGERSKRDNSPIFDTIDSTFAPGYVPGRKP